MKGSIAFARLASHRVVGVVILSLILFVGFFSFFPYIYHASSAESVSPWASTTSYPVTIAEQSCVTYSGYIYCVAGVTSVSTGTQTDQVNFAAVSSAGIGTWTETTYRLPTDSEESCVVYSDYIYCVGGLAGSENTNSTYYASLSTSGVGTWFKTTDYPETISDTSCVADSSYIYCVGGLHGMYSNSTYYAPLSSSGIGPWSATTDYPTITGAGSCVSDSGYIYCVGGIDSNSNTISNAVYYAPLSSSGIGTWSLSQPFPGPVVLQSCAPYSGYIYCVGGGNAVSTTTNGVYYAPLSSSGVGSWNTGTSYPDSIREGSCVIYSGYIYCVGGDEFPGGAIADAFYAEIIIPSTVTSTVTTTQDLTQTTTQTVTATTTATVTSTSSSKIPTTVKLNCSPNPDNAGLPTTCTAKVTASGGFLPLGKVKFSSSRGGTFSSVHCSSTMTALVCRVSYIPPASLIGKSTTIGADYIPKSGSSFAGSLGHTILGVTDPTKKTSAYIAPQGSLNQQAIGAPTASSPPFMILGIVPTSMTFLALLPLISILLVFVMLSAGRKSPGVILTLFMKRELHSEY
jgi:hypothetical protein